MKVCLIGLGKIGLPTALLIARQGLDVVGVDTNDEVVEKANQGLAENAEANVEQLLRDMLGKGKFVAKSAPDAADVFILNVPTPFKDDHVPDTSYVKSTVEAIIPLLKEGNLVIIESTCPVGTTEKAADLIFDKRPELRDRIFVAYCPERALPGNLLFEFGRNDRVVGGINTESTRKAVDFFSLLVRGQLHPTEARTAEMCKLTENAHRDLEIAFANELSMVCAKAGVNVWNLIDLANKHPRVNIVDPGCGVGGKYIPVDPYFIISEYPEQAKLMHSARDINDYKAHYCVDRILAAMEEFEVKHHRQPTVAMMGLSYKPNTDDLRHSPAKYIVTHVMQNMQNAHILIAEPNLRDHNVFKLTGYNSAYEQADIVVFLVAHNAFRSLQPTESKQILDFCGIFKDRKSSSVLLRESDRSDAENMRL